MLSVVDRDAPRRDPAPRARRRRSSSPTTASGRCRAQHGDQPYASASAASSYEVAYLPGVSDNRIFGGNSNWRGPIWFPMNFLLIQAIATFARYYDDSFTIECPDRFGPLPDARADRRRARAPADAHLRARREPRRTARRVRRQRLLPARPAVARLRAVLRVLPRRNGRRAGREPSDRMDRPRGAAAAVRRQSFVRWHGRQGSSA